MKFDVFDALDKLNEHFGEYSPSITVEKEMHTRVYTISLRVKDRRIGVRREIGNIPAGLEGRVRIMNAQYKKDIAFLKQKVDEVLSE